MRFSGGNSGDTWMPELCFNRSRNLTAALAQTTETSRSNIVINVWSQNQYCSGYSFGLSTKRTQVRAAMSNLGQFIHSILLQFTQRMNEYLAIDGGGYFFTNSFRALIAACFPKKTRWCLSEQVCQGIKCKAL